MRKTAGDLTSLKLTDKKPSKEILNHPELISLASGHNPLKETQVAFLKAYKSLGIDLIKRVPTENAPPSLKPGQTKDMGNGYIRSYVGLYDSVIRNIFPFKDVDDFWKAKEIKLDINKLITPEPHPLDRDDIKRRMNIVRDIGLYYYRLYTTLFMWAVEYLGWEVFMVAAIIDPEGFKEKFLDKAFQKSLEYINILSQIDCPFVFCHDDLADKNGPIFPPQWYEKYIFPQYELLWEPAKKAGKKVIFVADGNMSSFIEPLKKTGIDGVVFENPATNFDLILEHFSNKIIIGGIDAYLLNFGTPKEVEEHVLELNEKTKNLPGFIMSVCGGIHGSFPLKNLEAYFDARVKIGYTLEGWRKR